MLHSCLLESGIRSALYTSPHINDFRERIICGKKTVAKKFIIDFTIAMRPHIERIGPSFFEVATAMAFEYFSMKRVEIAVIETGLGGRLDSTNILRPMISVITGISIDHVQHLGSTISGIAGEKAGIIKRGVPVVAGKLPAEALDVIRKKAESEKSKLIDSSKEVKASITKKGENSMSFRIAGMEGEFRVPLSGDFQLINLRTVIATLRQIEKSGEVKAGTVDLERGLLNVKRNALLHGRFEKISSDPCIIVDVSHNEEAIRNLRKNLLYFRFRKLFVIMGMMNDKDYCACANEISRLDCKAVLTKPRYSRSADPAEMLKCVKRGRNKFRVEPDLAKAAGMCLAEAGKSDLILVTGSFYLAGEFLQLSAIRKLLKKADK